MNSRDRYLARASKMYHAQLRDVNPDDHPGIKAYLIDHGIFEAKVVETYRLGVVAEPLTGDEQFKGMISIPFLTKAGVKAIRFRNLNGKPKYLQHTGQTTRLYNTDAYFKAGDVIGIAEGEIDAIVATERLEVPTIGIPGCEMWTKYKRVWAPVFKNFQRVYVFTDGDPVNEKTGSRPGEELGKAVAESLGWRVRVIACPEGEDVSSMVASKRADELTARFGEVDDGDKG